MIGSYIYYWISYIIYTFKLAQYFVLGTILTTIWSLIIPPVKFNLYFYKVKEPVLDVFVDDNEKIIRTKIDESTNMNIVENNTKVCEI